MINSFIIYSTRANRKAHVNSRRADCALHRPMVELLIKLLLPDLQNRQTRQQRIAENEARCRRLDGPICKTLGGFPAFEFLLGRSPDQFSSNASNVKTIGMVIGTLTPTCLKSADTGGDVPLNHWYFCAQVEAFTT